MNAPTQEQALTLAPSDPTAAALPVERYSAGALTMNDASMDRMIRMAEIMATGKTTIPQHLRGSVGDCMAVVMQATQWGMNPFAVAQKTHLVNGTLGYEAQLVAAVINSSGVTRDRFHFDWFGDWRNVNGKTDKSSERGVRVWATLKGEDTPREIVVTMAQAGVRNSPLWEQDPRQQLAYLAQKRWARLYASDVILGVYTPDEFEVQAASQPKHMGAAQTVEPQMPAGLLEAAENAAADGVAAYQQFWQAASKESRKLLAGEHNRLKQVAIDADAQRTVEAEGEAGEVDDFVRDMEAAEGQQP
ncbi:RecT family recombinase [Caldimonas tepidiphila]|uniref:RecT family recombinase n=1 Tax=Caldimonas tepidiphila TaxID=2315841 RepID=UPI00196B21BD|nr:RecT family recombinase [Caldimonas tepidiphila]